MSIYMKPSLGFLLLTTKSFRFFRSLGVHVSPVHYYSPIPDIRDLEERPGLWDRASELPGISMDDPQQLQFMREVAAKYQPECDFPSHATPRAYDYHTDNVYFGYASAVAMYSAVREFRPAKVVEVGAGFSTLVICAAARRNASDGRPPQVTAVDPYPNDTLRAGVPGLTELIPSRVEDLRLDRLTSLGPNDILSIDSSHAVRTGGDVTYLYLEVLPRLAPGVLVHIHDIFLPYEYPHRWLSHRWFCNEQYLLQALLVHSKGFCVLWGQKYAETRFPEEYARTFGHRIDERDNHGSYSFWMRRC